MYTIFEFAGHEDMSDYMSRIDDLRDIALLSALPQDLAVRNMKHQWTEIAVPVANVTCEPSGGAADWHTTDDITGLPVNSTDILLLRVGDVLQLPTGEQVVVSAINGTASIDVYARGHGSSTGADQGTSNFEAYIVGRGVIQGHAAPAAQNEEPSLQYNYTEIYEDYFEISHSKLASWMIGGDEDMQILDVKLRKQLRNLDRSLIYGLRATDTANKFNTQGGIIEKVTTNSVNASTAALSLDLIYQAVGKCQGAPNMLLMGQTQLRKFAGLLDTKASRVEKLITELGSRPTRVQTPFGDLLVVCDSNMDVAGLGTNDEIYVCNTGLWKVGALNKYRNRQFHAYVTGPDGGSFDGVKLEGEYTNELRNEKGFCRLYGLATS
jgi:hypothetical protein